MHDPANEFRRIPLLGTWVNKGKHKGRSPVGPRPRWWWSRRRALVARLHALLSNLGDGS
jgi:hypothetical protein